MREIKADLGMAVSEVTDPLQITSTGKSYWTLIWNMISESDCSQRQSLVCGGEQVVVHCWLWCNVNPNDLHHHYPGPTEAVSRGPRQAHIIRSNSHLARRVKVLAGAAGVLRRLGPSPGRRRRTAIARPAVALSIVRSRALRKSRQIPPV